MKAAAATNRPSRRESPAHVSRAAGKSRAARERAEQDMSPAERLSLALELSDLCESLAAAGERTMQEQA